MSAANERLVLYDLTCHYLRQAWAGCIAPAEDLDRLVTSSAYWVCTGIETGKASWEDLLEHYIEQGLTQAKDECAAERQELALLTLCLEHARGPLVDIGAGWGRLAPLYCRAGLMATFVEPDPLGLQLMQRAGLRSIVEAQGEQLPFEDQEFGSIMMGWLLHHSSNVEATGVLSEAARVCQPDGLLISIEPLTTTFTRQTWQNLMKASGFRVVDVHLYYTMSRPNQEAEQYALATARRTR